MKSRAKVRAKAPAAQVKPAAAGDQPGPRPWLLPTLECACIAVLAGLLRFNDLGASPLWLDEAYSVLTALGSLSDIIDRLSRDGSPPLFFMLLHVWMRAFGTSETAVRALPAIFGAASVISVYVGARTLFPARRLAATAAAVIVAVGPLHVYYSRECRMYSFTPIIAVLTLLALHRGLETTRLCYWIMYAGLLAAGLYTHNYFLFILPIGPAAAMLTPGVLGQRRALVATLSATAAAALVYAPWIPVLVQQSRSGVGAWIPSIWKATPPSAALWRSFEVMGVSGAFPVYLKGELIQGAIPSPDLWSTLRILGALIGVGLVAGGFLTTRHGDRRERAAGIRLALLFALPLLLPWAASFAITPIYLVGRYETVAFVAYAILAGRGFGALVSRGTAGPAVATGVALVWLAGAGLCLTAYYRASTLPSLFDEQRTAEWLRGQAGPRDAVILPGYTCGVAEYYLARWGSAAERSCFPREVNRHYGWFDVGAAVRNLPATRNEAAALATDMRRVIDRGGRVFLVVSSAQTADIINRLLVDAMGRQLGDPSVAHPAPTVATAIYGPR
jgi:4-amino-4-deoxy-L-arabinose transferase-like glycosyltransferase